MGRTVPSYRIATEMERSKWKIFRQRLDKEDRKEFDKMFSYSRLYKSAGSNACRALLIHPNLLSIGALQTADETGLIWLRTQDYRTTSRNRK